MARSLGVFTRRKDALFGAALAAPVRGTAASREAIATCLQYGEWKPSPDALLFAGNGRQALTAAFSALAPIGGRIGFEALTYPVAKAAAAQLGLKPVALAMDAHGVRPKAIEAAHRDGALHALYLQPTAQNPLGITMPRERRVEIVDTVRRLSSKAKRPIYIVEDAVYGFLEPRAPRPLTALAPDLVVLVDSLSKRVCPGLTLGFICAAPALHAKLSNALRSGGWSAMGYAMAVGVAWCGDGMIRELEQIGRAHV